MTAMSSAPRLGQMVCWLGAEAGMCSRFPWDARADRRSSSTESGQHDTLYLCVGFKPDT